jgi:hypothetical protein
VFIVLLGSHFYITKASEQIEKPRIILGLSKIELNNTKVVGVQVNRVIRDCLWNNSPFDVRVPANRTPKNFSEVIPYAEGNRVREMMNWSRVSVLPLTPARAKRGWSDGLNTYGYYAADGQSNFLFLISPSKVTSPPFNKTVIRVSNSSNGTIDLICPETHGFNMVAEQAYSHRKDIYLAVACMDLPDKADAALYLAKNGINIYAPCDRFAYTLMNYRSNSGISTTILGSAPIKQTKNGSVIGDQPITIRSDEPIVVEYNDRENTMDRYCDTPWRYFNKLNQTYGLNLSLVKVYANTSEAGKLVEKAETINAKVIAVRVCTDDDYRPVAKWLEKNITNRAVLLHSVAYDCGNSLFKDFPNQTTFGDLNPVIERYKLDII